MRVLKTKAYGKLNLYLHITGVRPDGYHCLQTVFQTVSLHDQVSIILHNRGGISLRTNRPYLPVDERNLGYKAAQQFFAAAKIENRGLYINIKKSIPVGAGMAGGSTDAAAVLRLLNRAYHAPLSQEMLEHVGAELGADVPFCLRGGTVYAEGIGEQLHTIEDLPPCWIVICKPRVSVSTKTAYRLLDQDTQPRIQDVTGFLACLASGDLRQIAEQMGNDFERPIIGQYPLIEEVRQNMLAQGAIGARMTGSGSAVFGIFEDGGQAQKARSRLRKQYKDVFLAKPMGAL